jgi:probable rRNA maturation factor
MTLCITVVNRQSLWPVQAGWLTECLQQVLLMEQVASADIELSIVDDAEILRVNREFLGHDWPTDVISFSYVERPAGVDPLRLPRGLGLELDGELIVSAETALRLSMQHGWSPDDELLLYCVHGCLHLCGYDDQSDSEQRLMRQRERAALALFHRTPQEPVDDPSSIK